MCRQRRFAEGIVEYRKALDLDGGIRTAAAMEALATAYAECGQFEQAVAAAEQALQLAERAGQTERLPSLRAGLESYRAGRPHRPAAASGPATKR